MIMFDLLMYYCYLLGEHITPPVSLVLPTTGMLIHVLIDKYQKSQNYMIFTTIIT